MEFDQCSGDIANEHLGTAHDRRSQIHQNSILLQQMKVGQDEEALAAILARLVRGKLLLHMAQVVREPEAGDQAPGKHCETNKRIARSALSETTGIALAMM